MDGPEWSRVLRVSSWEKYGMMLGSSTQEKRVIKISAVFCVASQTSRVRTARLEPAGRGRVSLSRGGGR